MFVIGPDRGVNEYDLFTPFDASTRIFISNTTISEQETLPTGMAFSNDGTKMFVIGSNGNDVNEYDLSSPFDAFTLSHFDATSISLRETSPTGMAFSSDGTKMFVIGSTEDNVNEYDLSTPFDASTLSFVDATRIRAQEGNPQGMAFSSDGTKMFVIGSAGDDVNEYDLSAPFDASTRKFVDATRIRTQEGSPTGMAFSNDGAKMFVIGHARGNVNEYDLHSVYPVTVTRTPPTFVSSELDAEVLTITFSETIDAANIVPAKIHIRESGNYTHGTTLTAGELDTDADGATISFTLTPSHLATVAGLATPELTIEPGAVRDESGNLIVGTFDASTRTFVDATDILSKESIPTGMAFSSDGTKMFVIGSNRGVNEYDLSVPFDASTRMFNASTSISARESNPQGMAFSSDGTKMFVIGSNGNDVNEYDLSSPFDASTRSFVDETSISEQEFVPQDIAFSNDGTKMFVIGSHGNDVNEYDLSTPFDASTLSHVNATSISAQETSPTGMAFSNDGTKMFVIGSAGDDVNEYELSTPFDASTLSFVDATRIRAQETSPKGMAFSNDGAKMFVIGSTEDNVNEYDLHSVYPISVRDTTPPVITLTGPDTVTISVDGTYSDAGATCKDGVDGPITPTTPTGTVDTSQVGEYTVTYSCTDEAGNHAVQVTRTVIVREAADTTPPTFVSSELDIDTRVLTITFSETIDAANIVPAKIHIRESGNYTHGTTLTAGELDTDADGATVSFTLTPSHRAAVAGLATPETDHRARGGAGRVRQPHSRHL